MGERIHSDLDTKPRKYNAEMAREFSLAASAGWSVLDENVLGTTAGLRVPTNWPSVDIVTWLRDDFANHWEILVYIFQNIASWSDESPNSSLGIPVLPAESPRVVRETFRDIFEAFRENQVLPVAVSTRNLATQVVQMNSDDQSIEEWARRLSDDTSDAKD